MSRNKQINGFDLSNLPKIKKPSKAELFKSYSNQYNAIRVTDMNYWYPKYCNMTQKSMSIDLSIEDIKLMLSELKPNLTTRTKDKIKNIFKGEGKLFVKLNTRSPKDFGDCIFEFDERDNRVALIDYLIRYLSSSFRVFEDLCMFKALVDVDPNKYKCSIYFRDYIKDIDSNAVEYRVYVFNGEVKGVSKYIDKSIYPLRKELFLNKIKAYIKPIIDGEGTFVADLIVRVNSDVDDFEFELLELNPYYLSDPLNYGCYKSINENVDTYYL